MELHLRCVASHPKAVSRPPVFALSSHHPRVVTAADRLIVDHSTSTNAVRASHRTPAPVTHLVYAGSAHAYIAFLNNGTAISYRESTTAIAFAHQIKVDTTERLITLARAAPFGNVAVFVKSDSPSLWCVLLNNATAHMAPAFKLRADLEGDQDAVNFMDGMFAKARTKLTTNVKTKVCPIVAIAAHSSAPLVAAAYQNGIIRVWDVQRKVQQSHFDALLLLAEQIVDIAFHPFHRVLALCTTHGRVLTFNISPTVYKRADPPSLPVSRIRDRTLSFQSLTFTHEKPAYLLLLTSHARIMVKMITAAAKIINSTRYARPSRPIYTVRESLSFGQTPLLPTDNPYANSQKQVNFNPACASIVADPCFGLIACSTSASTAVQIFNRVVDGLPALHHAVSCGLDTPFSHVKQSAFKGPLMLNADSLFVQRAALYSYDLSTEQSTRLCSLPPGDIRRVEVARDEAGYCAAAIVFLVSDEDREAVSFMDEEQPLKSVLCTRRGPGDAWGTSEPTDGRSGCFLGPTGSHDRIAMLSNSGTTLSISAFQGLSNQAQNSRPRRGLQRVKLEGFKISRVFRTPFADWMALLYHDPQRKLLGISRNALARFTPVQGKQSALAQELDMDDRTAFKLGDAELVLDVRWQLHPYGDSEDRYLGAVMTDRRIYFTLDVLNVISKFEFQSIARNIASFAPPSCSWVGPCIALIHGSSLFAISMDGEAEPIASLSHAEGAATLVAGLADRIIYARPCITRKSVSVVSRPYSAMSGFVRGALALPKVSRKEPPMADSIKRVLDNHDVSQGSVQLVGSLLKSKLTPIAYLLLVSERGKDSIPPLVRASFLGRMGDIRGAAVVAESEYAQLSNPGAFHDGTELFRMLQRVFNMAFASGDVAIGKRCAGLLGRKGMLSSFVDCEGGVAAATAILDLARKRKSQNIVDMMRHIVARSSNSSIATDSSIIVSYREQEIMQRAIQSVDARSIPLGTEDRSQQLIRHLPLTNEQGTGSEKTVMEVAPCTPQSINDRLEMFRSESAQLLIETEEFVMNEDEDFLVAPVVDGSEQLLTGKGNFGGIGDDEDIFGDHEEPKSPSAVRMPDDGTTGLSAETALVVQEAARGTEELLKEQKQVTTAAVAGHVRGMHNVLSQQRTPETAIAVSVDSRVVEIHNRGLKKYGEGRWTSAQKELDVALRNFGRGRKHGAQTSNEILYSIVYYQMACRLRIAMEEIASSAHANTIAGRVTYAQLATTLTTLPLQLAHRIDGLVTAVDAALLLGNYGTAAKGLQMIKSLGVPENIRTSLRDKYNVCTTKGFTEMLLHPNAEVCYMSLKGLITGQRRLSCSVCPAVFAEDSGLVLQSSCPCCGLGIIRVVS